MYHIQEIQKLLNCDSVTAEIVAGMMSVDFSECTKEQFDESAKLCYILLKEKRQ